MFNTLFVQPLASGLILFYRLLGGSLGWAIVGFSAFLKLILNPLTKPYLTSMEKMKELNPQLEKLKKKFKNDRTKLAQAQAELYRQHKVNPGAGCLPYILQIVIFFAFLNVFTKTLYFKDNLTQKFNELLYPPLRFSQDEVINTKFIYLDLTQPDTLKVGGLSFPLPGPVIFLAALAQFLSSKMMMPAAKAYEKKAKKTKGTTDDLQASMQKSMIYTFPLMTLYIGMKFPSGLALYWLVFSLLQFLQQYLNSRPNFFRSLISRFGLLKSVSSQNENSKRS